MEWKRSTDLDRLIRLPLLILLVHLRSRERQDQTPSPPMQVGNLIQRNPPQLNLPPKDYDLMAQNSYLGVKDTDELVVGEGALAVLRRVHACELRATLLEHARLGIPAISNTQSDYS